MAPNLSPSIEQAVERLTHESTISTLLHATARELSELLGAQRCTVSRAVGDLLVEVSAYQLSGATPQLDLYLASDYPLTQEVLELGEPRTVSLDAADADPAEGKLLRRLAFSELLMLPLTSRGRRWGLVEVYGSDRPFDQSHVEVGQKLLGAAEELLGKLEHG